MELLQGFSADFLANVLFSVVVVNAIFSALSVALDKLAPLTKTKKDDELAAFLKKYLPVAQKAIDFLSANRQHGKK